MLSRGAVGKHLLEDRRHRCQMLCARLGRDAANPKGHAELLRRESEYLSFSSADSPASTPPCSAESKEGVGEAKPRAEQRQESGWAELRCREGRSRLWQLHPGGLSLAGAAFISIPALSQADEGEERCRRPFCAASFSFYRAALSLPPDAEGMQ